MSRACRRWIYKMATNVQVSLVKATQSDLADISNLLDCAFGPGREAKTSYRLREGIAPCDELCFLARDDETGALCGSIQYWPIDFIFDDGSGVDHSLLLGPIAIRPDLQGQGIGQLLINHTLDLATKQGYRSVILVGDEPYYAKVGFSMLGAMGLRMPGPFDPSRLLGRNLAEGALTGKPARIVKPV